MKDRTLTLLTFFTMSLSTFSQVNSSKYSSDTSSVYPNLDTLKFFFVILRSETINKSTTYMVNNQPVDQKTYEKYNSAIDNIKKCRPCFLKTYDVNDALIREGVQYTDCAVGIWTEYYLNGKIKVIGNYKVNDTGNWDDLWKRGYCSSKEGLWTFYNENGIVTKTENYKNGILIK